MPWWQRSVSMDCGREMNRQSLESESTGKALTIWGTAANEAV